MTALTCSNVHRSFTTSPQELKILNGVSLRVEASHIVAILGPSGSGKSTLLHLLAGLDKPSKGEIFWGDVPVHLTDKHSLANLRLVNVGLIFQNHYLLEDLSVIDNISLSGRLRGNLDKKRALQLLEAVGLSDRRDFLPKKLSGGERQRVAVARALYPKPKLILADEPTGNLDEENAKTIYEMLVTLAKHENTAIVMVTHDENLVSDVDQRYYLKDGLLNQQ